MRIRNYIGEAGKSIMEYVAENDVDREQLVLMMADGSIPDSPAQSEPKRENEEPVE